MNLVNQIKNKIGDYVFERKMHNQKRNVKAINLKNAVTIGILYDASNENTYNTVKHWVKVFRENKKKVKGLGYINTQTFQAHHLAKLEFDFFSSADLNWYNHSKSSIINNFINEKFDILIDLNFDNNKPTYYIAGLSQSPFKVGRRSQQNNRILDLFIEIDQNKDLDYFMTQAQYYLQLINSNE